MQLKASLLSAIACTAVTYQAAMAEPLSCRGGHTHVTITHGSAVTANLSAIRQIGHLCVRMEDDQGKEVFNDCGALIGTVTATDTYGNPTKFSHTAAFEPLASPGNDKSGYERLESFKTVDDTLFFAAPVDNAGQPPCAFNVRERFTTMGWGTGVFKDGALNMEAVGVVSFCPSQNYNAFVLSGDACLKLKK